MHDKEYDAYYSSAAEGRLDDYGEYAHIDMIALRYGYTHEQVFNLSWGEVMTIIALGKEKSYVEATANAMYRAAQNK